ncbi:hypothetical protein ACJA88_009121 [Fusarium oxysporum]
MTFQYNKLPNNGFFRIFELKPGKDGDPLQGNLRTYARKETPKYEALRIFALISLAGDRTYGIVPDYHKTESEVFTEFTLKVLSETKKLAMLNYSDVEDPNHKEQLPLWAPRWHPKDWPDFYDMSDYGFKCSNNMEIALGSPINIQVLHLKGLYVDKVKMIKDWTPVLDQNVIAIGSMVIDHERLLNDQYGQDIIRPFVLTMMSGRVRPVVFGILHQDHPEDDCHLNYFIAFMIKLLLTSLAEDDDDQHYQRKILRLIKMAVDLSPLATHSEPIWKEPETWEFFNNTLTNLYPHDKETVPSYLEVLPSLSCNTKDDFVALLQNIGHCFQRKFFITERGYIGTGPRSLELGDSVCILFGGDARYIVRPRSPSSDEYIFLGNTYVHGIMEREATTTREEQKDSQDPKFQERLFKLI